MSESDRLHVPAAAKTGIDSESKQSDLVSRIQHLVRERPYGVLCTQGRSPGSTRCRPIGLGFFMVRCCHALPARTRP